MRNEQQWKKEKKRKSHTIVPVLSFKRKIALKEEEREQTEREGEEKSREEGDAQATRLPIKPRTRLPPKRKEVFIMLFQQEEAQEKNF